MRHGSCLSCRRSTDEGDFYAFWYQYLGSQSGGNPVTGEYTVTQWIGERKNGIGFLCSSCSTGYLIVRDKRIGVIALAVLAVSFLLLVLEYFITGLGSMTFIGIAGLVGIPISLFIAMAFLGGDSIREHCGELAWSLFRKQLIAKGEHEYNHGIPLSGGHAEVKARLADYERYQNWKTASTSIALSSTQPLSRRIPEETPGVCACCNSNSVGYRYDIEIGRTIPSDTSQWRIVSLGNASVFFCKTCATQRLKSRFVLPLRVHRIISGAMALFFLSIVLIFICGLQLPPIFYSDTTLKILFGLLIAVQIWIAIALSHLEVHVLTMMGLLVLPMFSGLVLLGIPDRLDIAGIGFVFIGITLFVAVKFIRTSGHFEALALENWAWRLIRKDAVRRHGRKWLKAWHASTGRDLG